MSTLRTAVRSLRDCADATTLRLGILAVLLVIGGAILATLAPILLKLAVDAMQGEQAATRSILLVLGYVLLLYIVRLIAEWRAFAEGRAGRRLQRRLSATAFDHLLNLPMSFFVRSKTGAVVDALEQGLRGYDLLLQPGFGTLLPAAIELAAVAFVLVHFAHPEYLIALGGAVLAYVWVVSRRALSIHGPAEAVIDAHLKTSAALTEALVNVESIKLFNANRSMAQRHDAALEAMERAWLGFLRRRARSSIAMATIFTAALGASLILAAVEVSRGSLTLGEFVLVHAYVIRLLTPMEMVGFAVRDVIQGLAGIRSLVRLMDESGEQVVGRGARDVRRSVPTLEFDGVTFGYEDGRPVLTDVTFSVPAGRTVAVVGANGSGKSTLIRLILRLYEPHGGRIRLGGTPIDQLDVSTLRELVALVPQDTTLFHDTLASNIAFGVDHASAEHIREAARFAGLHDFIESLPDGYHTLAGDRGLRLSGGERQRVAIARALLRRARLLLFDEATSSLDARTEAGILRRLASLSENTTTLVIAHRLSTIVHADSIVVLHAGQVAESGTHTQLLRRDGHYAALWKAQQYATH